jgi:hypothetical protein
MRVILLAGGVQLRKERRITLNSAGLDFVLTLDT